MKTLLNKICLFVCFTISAIASFSQVEIKTIPADGILLDKGWKFHAGDNPEWAKPNYDDKDWQPINPALDIRHIPEVQNISVYWFRLTLHVDSSLMDEPLGILLSQVGACEIYLDGKLLYKLGTIDVGNKKISTRYLLGKPLQIKTSSHSTQVLAIRYGYEPTSFLIFLGNPNFCFNAVLNTSSATFENYQLGLQRSDIYEIVQMSMWLLLTIMGFCFYFISPAQEAYKYIGYAALCMLLGRILPYALWDFANTIWISFAILLSAILTMLANLLTIQTFNLLFNQKKTLFYYFIILFILIVTASFIFLYDFGVLLWSIYFILTGVEYLRSAVKARKNKYPGAIIIIYTVLIWLVLLILAPISLVYNSINAAYFFMSFCAIEFAIGWSIFLAYDYARTGLALKARVKEVEELSEEKHRILSEQNIMLEKQVEQRTAALNKSLQELKSTQAQLIQSEKMASLGELTAGIAHEIQNPLNFVNNFSEVSNELLDEMKEELATGNGQSAIEIADDVKQNLEKILHHGKRADAIVKGMLQHSRVSTGNKEPTDINALADEYLRLSYHGMRAKDKSFNATLQTDFDSTIGKINIVSQDIGRVLLNLFNNAFYAVMQKNASTSSAGHQYEPTVSVYTKKIDGKIEIRVKDNGNGIPQKVVDKIFQPFFTTKPTGQGTGLGLSLSYDIIKAHRGEIKVETKGGEGAEFIIHLPV